METSLVRPLRGRIIAGVCLGLAQRFNLPVWLVRLVFILLAILPPAAVLPYLVLWLLIPSETQSQTERVIDVEYE